MQMASLVCSEPQAVYERRPLSVHLEALASSSPFPSPGSSFLPPPTPDATEFAMKPAPVGRASKKSSLVPKEDGGEPFLATPTSTQTLRMNGSAQDSLKVQHLLDLDPNTPTAAEPVHPPPSTRSQQVVDVDLPPTTPVPPATRFSNNALPTPSSPHTSEEIPTTPVPHRTEPPNSTPPPSTFTKILMTPITTAFHTSSDTEPSPSTFTFASAAAAASLTPTRRAPPSPALSRRVSQAPSTCSTRSSTSLSRSNSQRKSGAYSSGSTTMSQSQNRLSAKLQALFNSTNNNKKSKDAPSSSSSPLHSPHAVAFPHSFPSPSVTSTSTTCVKNSSMIPALTPQVLIRVRDFAYAPTDERHNGLGADVPYANRVDVLNRRLRGEPEGDDGYGGGDGDGDGDGSREVQEEEDDAWDQLRAGVGRFSVSMSAAWVGAGGSGVSQVELERNFEADEEDGDGDGEVEEGEGEDEDEEPLYPGLYKALYAFEPEGTAEMGLVEDQVVRVIGRGGGVGWAVVLDEGRHALVPESYLEAVRLDWEGEV